MALFVLGLRRYGGIGRNIFMNLEWLVRNIHMYAYNLMVFFIQNHTFY